MGAGLVANGTNSKFHFHVRKSFSQRGKCVKNAVQLSKKMFSDNQYDLLLGYHITVRHNGHYH